MKNIKKIIKSFLYMLCFFFTSCLLITILNYYNIFNYKIINIIKIIIPIMSFSLGGFIVGKKSIKNGWLEGIKFSTFVSILLIMISLLTKNFKLEYLIYIIILITAGIFGSMIGINKK